VGLCFSCLRAGSLPVGFALLSLLPRLIWGTRGPSLRMPSKLWQRCALHLRLTLHSCSHLAGHTFPRLRRAPRRWLQPRPLQLSRFLTRPRGNPARPPRLETVKQWCPTLTSLVLSAAVVAAGGRQTSRRHQHHLLIGSRARRRGPPLPLGPASVCRLLRVDNPPPLPVCPWQALPLQTPSLTKTR
jgi:hypothetical protein